MNYPVFMLLHEMRGVRFQYRTGCQQ